MKTILKSSLSLLLIVFLLAGISLSVTAAEKVGKITITLEDENKNKINGLRVSICHVAELNDTGYFPTKAFENSGISIAGILNNPNEATTKTLVDFIKKNKVSVLSKTSKNSQAVFSNLSKGIWVVFCENNKEYTFNPYIIFLPYESGGKLYYDVMSVPKTENIQSDKISVYVLKKWDDKNNAAGKRPDSVTVELLRDKKVVAKVKLSEDKGWSHTFKNLEKDGKYSVREKKIENYKASYGGDAAEGFVITNTYIGQKLPQTGQHWWPIIVIGIAGLGFILLGIYEVAVMKNEKKK